MTLGTLMCLAGGPVLLAIPGSECCNISRSNCALLLVQNYILLADHLDVHLLALLFLRNIVLYHCIVPLNMDGLTQKGLRVLPGTVDIPWMLQTTAEDVLQECHGPIRSM